MKTSLLLLSASFLALHVTAAAGPPADYVAHEWGTFTSVQGADGVQLEWNPLLVTELPKFVHDRSRALGGRPLLAAKTALVARQRLETPVIYFYSKQAREVDVAVRFPQGTVTEWFPQLDPPPTALLRAGDPAARWQHLHVAAPDGTPPALVREAAGSHYYAARETAANFVSVTSAGTAAKIEWEKFLFYRGVGAFEAPLKVTLVGVDSAQVRLTNAGTEELRDLFLCRAAGSQIAFVPIERIAPGAHSVVSLDQLSALPDSRERLATGLRTALVQAGLYAPEAGAMVKTWEDSWLAESGLRVLYLLPRAWADRVLPLTFEPAPREIARVMVGRAEILTPSCEQALAQEIERYRTGDEAARSAAVTAARALELGRFAEPAVRRLALADPQNRAFNNAAWELLMAAFAPLPPAPIAQRK